MYESFEAYSRPPPEVDPDLWRDWLKERQVKLARALGRYRGIDPAHRHLYEAEALFRLSYEAAVPADIKALIMEAVRLTGPLNEPPDASGMARFVKGEVARRSDVMLERALMQIAVALKRDTSRLVRLQREMDKQRGIL